MEMGDLVSPAVISAVIGAIVGGLMSLAVARQQIRVVRDEHKATQERFALQLQWDLIRPGIVLAGNVLTRSTIDRLEQDGHLLDDLRYDWGGMSHAVDVVLAPGLNESWLELNQLMRVYLGKLGDFTDGRISKQDLESSRRMASDALSVLGRRMQSLLMPR
jgi:hypothetical protein